jgi:hypothetical protein
MFSAVGVSANTGMVYVTQRGNSTIPPVLLLNTTGELVAMWGAHDIAVDSSSPPAATWGAHGLSIEDSDWPIAEECGSATKTRIYVEDFTNHTVTAFCGDASGRRLFQIGTPGVAGNGTKNPVSVARMENLRARF